MNDSCRVHVFHSSQNLVYQKLDMVIGEPLSPHDSVEICPHQWCHQVQIRKSVDARRRCENIQEANDLIKKRNRSKMKICTSFDHLA